MNVDEFVSNHPVVFHMADRAAWPSIQRHGLLSTAGLLDLFEASDESRRAALSQVRRSSINLTHPVHGSCVIRDQGPLKFIDRCLTENATTQEFLDALNHRVFFWATPSRLERLLGARRYRHGEHVILHVDTASLVARYGEIIELSPYNTGSVHVPTAPPRGPGTYQPIVDYPYEAWRTKRGASGDAVAEVTVPGDIPDILEHVVHIETVIDGARQPGIP